MRTSRLFFARLALLIATLGPTVAAQEKGLLPPPDRAPHLILAHNGPHAPVRALAFSADGSTLFVGGFDKQVRRYQHANGKFVAKDVIRVPIGPGNAGVVNAVAVSPDGKWIAVTGRAPIRGENWASAEEGIGEDFRRLPTLLKRDSGVVYLFDPNNPNGGKVIRGQESEVRALAFANPAPASGPVLVTAGLEWNEKGEYFGTVRLFNVKSGEEISSRKDLPPSNSPPGLAAWATGAKKDGLRVVVAWDALDANTSRPLPSKMLTWDNPGTAAAESSWDTEALLISPLAVRIGNDRMPKELLTGGYDPKANRGGLKVRPAEGGEVRTEVLKSADNRLLLPTAIEALTIGGIGDATALLLPLSRNAAGSRYELRLLTPKGTQSVTLTGFHPQRPVLAASPDGRFIAVGGFSDNRVEVYDAAAFAAGKPTAMKLSGAADGFAQVAFLRGTKLWLGRDGETIKSGGVVLDLDAKVRVAVPVADAGKVEPDAPAGVAPRILEADAAKKLPWRVLVTLDGVEKTIALAPGERATAAAFLPSKPAWDATLGPVVAIAHMHDRSQAVLVKLYDAATGKLLCNLGGPTLPVRSLAFSATRPLLAGAGDDGTVAIWTLKNIGRQLPHVEGLFVTERGGAVVVAAVNADSPAAGKLQSDDVIESVADAKGAQQPVKTPLDFVLTVRSLKIGSDAQLKVKGKAAVAVRVGAATSFRHPLFSLWVNPAQAPQRDWIGWTSAGPYDTSGEAGEAHIGWLTATGTPARPVAFAGAEQYRKLYYKRDIIRLLLEKADYNDAVSQLPQPRQPTIMATLIGNTEQHDGRLIAREKLDGVEISLNDPDAVLDLTRTALRWQLSGPEGATEWEQKPFTGRTRIDLTQHRWKRGEHSVHVKLFKSPDLPLDAPPVDELTVVVPFIPPAPELSVQIDGKPYLPGTEVVTANDEVQVGVVINVKEKGEEATVVLSANDGGKPVELRANKNGTFDPVKVKLNANAVTVLLITATNRGVGVRPDIESRSVEVRTRKLPPKMVAPPAVKLLVETPYDFRTKTDAPYVVSTEKVLVRATVQSKDPLTVFEWKIGDADWQAGKLDAASNSETRVISLPAAKPLVVQLRARSKESAFAEDRVQLEYAALPEVTVAMPPVQVINPELKLSGGLKVRSKRPFRVRVVVTSSRSGRTREFEPMVDGTFTKWDAGLTLFPGGNQLGYIISYDDDRKEVRNVGLVEVHYLRQPVIAGAAPVDAGSGAVGDLTLAVLSAPDAAPTELWVNGTRVGFRTRGEPVSLFGMPIWLLTARGISVNRGDERLKSLSVVVKNTEQASQRVSVDVRGKPPEPVPPPQLRLTHAGASILPDQPLVVGEARFTFALHIHSESPLMRVEVWRIAGGDAAGEEVGNLNPAAAVAVGGGFELRTAPALKLRPGVNIIRVLAANGSDVTATTFSVSYTPPPVRVVIEAIREPNGKVISFTDESLHDAHVATPMIEVEGRVEWDFDNEPLATDQNLSVVFVANGIAHLPVRVAPAKESKQRKFRGRVFLNAFGSTDPTARGVARLRVELRSGGHPVPIPQQGLSRSTLTVTTDKPLRRQRLHLVMVGVEVPAAERRELVKRVITAVGGTIPNDNPNFIEGRFTRPDFELAYLYSPRLGYTKSGDLNALLNAVRADIERRSKRPDDDWVNDVIVVYYQGEDWMEPDGRWLLHSATTLSGAAGKNLANHGIRLDSLPLLPGMPVAVVNVSGRESLGHSMAVELAFLRCAWANPNATQQLLPLFENAVKRTRTLGEIGQFVAKEAGKTATIIPGLQGDPAQRIFGITRP